MGRQIRLFGSTPGVVLAGQQTRFVERGMLEFPIRMRYLDLG